MSDNLSLAAEIGRTGRRWERANLSDPNFRALVDDMDADQ
jgi:hypothetical protein